MNENKWILRKGCEVETVPADGRIKVARETASDYRLEMSEMLDLIHKIKSHSEPPKVDGDAFNTRHPWDKFGGVSSGICQGWFWFRDEVILSRITLDDALAALEEFNKGNESQPPKKHFTVNIKETLERTVIIAADSKEEAEELADVLSGEGDIQIEYDHFSGRTVEVLRESTENDETLYCVYEKETEI